MKVKILNSQTLCELKELNLALATRIEGGCLVGRSPNSCLVLDSPDVSRLHGKFFFQNGNYYFSDIGSSNGSIVNGNLAETNQIYVLKAGDVIRIGEFVLLMEEIIPVPEELPATVIGGIDATVISGWRSNAKLDTPKVANQTPEPGSQVPEVISQAPEAVGVPEAVSQPPDAVSEVPEVVTVEVSDLLTQPSEEVSEVSEVTSLQELTIIQVPEEADASEITYVQVPEVVEAAAFDAIAPAFEEVNEVPESTSFQAEITIIQAPGVAENSEVTSDSAPEVVSEFPQPVIQTPEQESAASSVIAEMDSSIQAPPAVAAFDVMTQAPEEVEEAAVSDSEVTSDLAPEAVSGVPELVTQTSEEVEVSEAAYVQVPEVVEQAAVFDATTQAPEEVNEVPESTRFQDVTSIQVPEAAEVFEVTDVPAPEAVSEVTQPVTQTPEEESAADDESVIAQIEAMSEAPKEVEAPEEVSEVPSLVSEISEVASVEDLSSIQAPVAAQAFDEITQAPEEDQTPEVASKAFEIISKKYIALMAHDSKKSDLAQLVAQHKDFLSKCLTIATPSISETLYQQAAVAISQKTPSVPVGGYQAVASLVGTGEILAVIFLRDFMVAQSGQANEEALLRLCNINQVLLATNVPTADAIIHYIKAMVTSL
jgi:methylglyoxal synthase